MNLRRVKREVKKREVLLVYIATVVTLSFLLALVQVIRH